MSHTPQDVCADHTARPRLPACDQLSTPAGACSVRGTPHTVVVPHHCLLTLRLLGPDLGWLSFCNPQSFLVTPYNSWDLLSSQLLAPVRRSIISLSHLSFAVFVAVTVTLPSRLIYVWWPGYRPSGSGEHPAPAKGGLHCGRGRGRGGRIHRRTRVPGAMMTQS